MQQFANILRLGDMDNPRILDVGGTPGLWEFVKAPLRITILNLPGSVKPDYASHHQFDFVEGDGCNLQPFGDHSFDIVFSNSVIEHVGDTCRQEAFAREIQRVGKHFWVQTPAKYFPIEAHTGMPGWWYYPKWLRRYILRNWKLKVPGWETYIEQTTVLTKSELRRLFPKGKIKAERFLFLPKSYIVHSLYETCTRLGAP
jgi:hypothetical protein